MKRLRILTGLFVVICLLAGLVSCNRDNGPKIEFENDVTDVPDSSSGIKDDTNNAVITPEPTETPKVSKTLIVAGSDLCGKFSPFYAESKYDMDVVKLTQSSLLTGDRAGAVLLGAMNGQKTEYNGNEYEYQSIGNCDIVENEDGTVDYNISMRDDIVFSDGVKATIDDVIFALYVMADPSYDSTAAFSSLPVVGMKEYRSSMEPLFRLLIKAGRSNKDFTYWDEETQNTFWQDIDAAGHLFIRDICDFCEDNFGRLDGETDDEKESGEAEKENAEKITGANAGGSEKQETEESAGSGSGSEEDENAASEEVTVTDPEEEAARVRRAMFFWGYEDEWIDGMTVDDFWQIMCREYKDDILLLQENESIRGDVFRFVPDFEVKYSSSVDVSASVKSISGIKRTGDYSVTITMSELNNSDIYNLPLYLVPMHYYGDEKLYDYEASSFGFVKGNLSEIIEKSASPMGCGPYILEGFSNGYVTLKANEKYFKGKPNIDTVILKATDNENCVEELKNDNIDIAVVSSRKDIEEIKKINSNGEISGDVIYAIPVRNNGYGYIGCNIDQVNVGKAPSSVKSKALRKAFMTLFAMYREEAVEAYFGDLANVIQYPVSDISWSAPNANDEGYKEAFNLSSDNEIIRRYGDSREMLCERTMNAVIGYFKAAGFTWDEQSKTFTAAAENARLSYDIVIPGGGFRDHPSFIMADKAAGELAKIGITLNIKDVSVSTWQAVLEEGKADFWAGALYTSVDPDVYDIYHSDNLKGESKGLNLFSVNDKELDELIIKAREGKTNEERKEVYGQVYDMIMDMAFELPFYQKNEFVIASVKNVDSETLPKEITPYYEWYSEIESVNTKE